MTLTLKIYATNAISWLIMETHAKIAKFKMVLKIRAARTNYRGAKIVKILNQLQILLMEFVRLANKKLQWFLNAIIVIAKWHNA